MIYLNHAGTSWPKPEPVRKAVAEAMDAPVDAWATRLEAGRRAVARSLALEPTDELLLTPGATSALAVAIGDQAWQPGDRILVSGFEHHALHRAALLLERRGVDVVVARSGADEPFDLEAAEETLRQGRVRVVAVTAASNVTGALLPIDEIACLARAHGASCVVDAAQTAGWLPVGAILRAGADVVAFAGHKGPQAPWGIGGLCSAPSAAIASPRADGARERPGYCDVGSVDRVALAGLAAGLAWLDERPHAHRLQRARAQIERVRAHLCELRGLTVHGPAAPDARMPIVAFSSDQAPAATLAAQLEREGVLASGGLQCAPLAHRTLGTLPDGVVRISVGPMTRDDEVEESLGVIAACVQREHAIR